ncbi:MDR family NADP-dependent oxidoreductase [Aspergillus clavatus NRRL 1]|uniref:Alcohol dehydrogenase, zinc-containing n=1 Tax=Aspergillus clavatus (strain ATCC 1007 / CBS 513.65 / DSM 816 / NCTC 3887 / NRRL 1 / QM 1276 / 107) TaxID=344612 RepID=A1CDD9_ASPCL|nr:alcohol dehydrogenase, zinc-containing [Aspergillus clavatus NRRL 1]EAW11866.1 alcohol dehydrogenase, zinc-containing [Aspergillus clavatus NRRL 1]
MPISNRQVIYANTPSPAINPSLKDGTFKLNTTSIPDQIPHDKVLVRVHYLSLDPAMRQWLTAKRSYIAPVERGSVMRGQSIAQVIRVGRQLQSQYKVGDWVVAYSGWQEYCLLGPKEAQKVVVPPGCLPTDAMSVLGMTGLTAYFGMTEVGQPKAGETVVVSGAAGATGMVAGQIAKIKGAKRVIGLAGSADKCAFLVKELGFDVAINYKDADWKNQLKEATPEYIDVYFDNVGGEILDACLARAQKDARFAICGAISQYNSAKPQGPASFMNVISQRVTMKGFIVFDYAKKYEIALKDLSTWLSQGKIKRKEHIIHGGLEAAPQGLVDLYKGANTGKMMVEVAPVSEAIGEKARL